MHVPDAVLSIPVASATAVVGVAGAAWVSVRLRERLRDRTTSMMGMMAACIFAAQMVNFPVFPGVSGHLMGGTLAAVVLGPWAGAGAIGAVLIVQCLLFADGGLTALGANFVNMSLVGAVPRVRHLRPDPAGDRRADWRDRPAGWRRPGPR